ncbi:hypothetical protein BMWSH_3954 [Priestia megaterium WSH-002]|uniref:Uncharacterized protein n=1 Tax=Priestia megaterium (strain WSH-002) TaxID=1006007 RepID=A0A8D3X1Q0_PRIMW|nr:hypothetical protein BMWSH_3954 [Priestia megaterium WSH-002]
MELSCFSLSLKLPIPFISQHILLIFSILFYIFSKNPLLIPSFKAKM